MLVILPGCKQKLYIHVLPGHVISQCLPPQHCYCRASWAAGTGYGYDHSRLSAHPSPIWDAKHAEASQAAQDAELEKLLIDLAQSESPPFTPATAAERLQWCHGFEQ